MCIQSEWGKNIGSKCGESEQEGEILSVVESF